MNVIIENANQPSYGECTIPLPLQRKEYDHSLGQLQQMEIGDVLEEDCWVIGMRIVQSWRKLYERNKTIKELSDICAESGWSLKQCAK